MNSIFLRFFLRKPRTQTGIFNLLFLQRFLFGLLFCGFSFLSWSEPPGGLGANSDTDPATEASALIKSVIRKAYFAGGCFWCMEPPFDQINGVLKTTSGYMGGTKKDPTYDEVSSGKTGHFEVIEIEYDEKKVTYDKLLEVFWQNIDFVDDKGQFCDQGSQYLSAVFTSDAQEMGQFNKSKSSLEKQLKKRDPKTAKVVTSLRPMAPFYPAEEYHQDYYKKNPVRYKIYRLNCGRDKRLKQLQKLLTKEKATS